MEIYCRDLTKEFSDVRIISGPLWKPVDTPEPEVEEEKNLQNGRKRKPHKIMKYPVKICFISSFYVVIFNRNKLLVEVELGFLTSIPGGTNCRKRGLRRL